MGGCKVGDKRKTLSDYPVGVSITLLLFAVHGSAAFFVPVHDYHS